MSTPSSFSLATFASFFWIALTTSAFAEGESHLPPNHMSPMVVDFSSVPDEASVRPVANNGDPHHVHARLLTDKTSDRCDSMRLGIHLELDDGWHTYWKSPGDIGRPTLIDWSITDENGAVIEELEPSEHQYPVPTQFDQSGMISYGYDEQVLLISTLEIPADFDFMNIIVQAKVEWLVCKESCIPGDATVRLPLSIGNSSTPSDYALFNHVETHPHQSSRRKDFAIESTLSVDAVLPESTLPMCSK